MTRTKSLNNGKPSGIKAIMRWKLPSKKGQRPNVTRMGTKRPSEVWLLLRKQMMGIAKEFLLSEL
ncbi:MAG: hypothetical protein V8R80_05960, partial [Eubacterium sp.]